MMNGTMPFRLHLQPGKSGARTKRASVLIGNHQPIGSARKKRASVLRGNRQLGIGQTTRVSGILGSRRSNGADEQGPHSREHLQGHL